MLVPVEFEAIDRNRSIDRFSKPVAVIGRIRRIVIVQLTRIFQRNRPADWIDIAVHHREYPVVGKLNRKNIGI